MNLLEIAGDTGVSNDTEKIGIKNSIVFVIVSVIIKVVVVNSKVPISINGIGMEKKDNGRM